METKEATHTPGPWGCTDTSNHAHDYRLTKPNGDPLPLHVEANDHTEQRANARLIAAAPDLLAALEALLAVADQTDCEEPMTEQPPIAGDYDLSRMLNDSLGDAQDAARAAIAAAKGGR